MPRSAGSAISPSRIASATTIEEIFHSLAKHDCIDLSLSIDSSACGKFPHAGGGYCDVYRGALYDGTSIAIKTLRIYDGPEAERDSNSQKILERAARELYHWSKLQHRNVLPLMGLGVFRGQISVISKWIENGSLDVFLRSNPDANRPTICADICEGLCYIHANGLVHGDLKGANVMVAPDGTAMITDFGNTQLKEFTLKFSTTANSSSSVRWAAPELLLEDGDPQVSKEADVYAYGMTVLEVLTGKVPFEGISDGQALVLVAIEKKVPTRPDIGMPDDLWDLLNSCWIRKPFKRPEITSVKKKLKVVTRIGEGPARIGEGPATIGPETAHINKGLSRIPSRFVPPIIVDRPPPPIPNDSYSPYSSTTSTGTGTASKHWSYGYAAATPVTPVNQRPAMLMPSLAPRNDPDDPRNNPSARRRANVEDAATSAYARALEQARKLAAGEDDDEEEEEEIRRYIRSKFGDQGGQNYSEEEEESEEEETSEEESESSSLQMEHTVSARQRHLPSHPDLSYPDREHDYPGYPRQDNAYPYRDRADSYRDNVFPHYAAAASATPVTQPLRKPSPLLRSSPGPMESSPLSEDSLVASPVRTVPPEQLVELSAPIVEPPTRIVEPPTRMGEGPTRIGEGPTIIGPGPTHIGKGPTHIGEGPSRFVPSITVAQPPLPIPYGHHTPYLGTAMSTHARALEQARLLATGSEDDEEEEEEPQSYVRSKWGGWSGQNDSDDEEEEGEEQPTEESPSLRHYNGLPAPYLCKLRSRRKSQAPGLKLPRHVSVATLGGERDSLKYEPANNVPTRSNPSRTSRGSVKFSRSGTAQPPLLPVPDLAPAPPLPTIRTPRPWKPERGELREDHDWARRERERYRQERGVLRNKAEEERERGFEYGQVKSRGLLPNVRGGIIGSATAVEEIVHALAMRGCPDLTLSINLGTCSDFPCAGGGFCDVYRGALHDSRGTRIAIKSLRVYDGSEAEGDSESRKILKRAARELYHWSKLHHCNVLPLLGLAIFRGQLTMISEWMEYGNLVSYLRFKPDAHRNRLCMDVCEGLCYIHMNGMIHGDLKAANVVVSSRGIAMIADFGNTQLKDLTLKFSNTKKGGFSVRWAAPELLLEDSGPQFSKEADVYAYGMTVLETLTNKVPYEGTNDNQVLILVAVKRKVPPRPNIDVCGDDLWDLLNSCWAREPSKRPQITIVKSRLQILFSPPSNSRLIDGTRGNGSLNTGQTRNSGTEHGSTICTSSVDKEHPQSSSVRRPFTPPRRSTTERIVVAVTRDAANYVVVDLTGHTDAQAIRERLLSKLHIPADLYSSFSIYRTELGDFAIGTALDDTQLLLTCQHIGDNKGSLKFLAQRSGDPATPYDNVPSSSRWLRSPGMGLQPLGLPDFTGFDEEPDSLRCEPTNNVPTRSNPSRTSGRGSANGFSRSGTAQPPPLPPIIVTSESLSQPGTQQPSSSSLGPTDKSPNLGILSSGLLSARLSHSPVPDVAPAAHPDSQHPRTKEGEAEKARDREVEKVQQRELEKAREQELKKAKERERRREKREREKAERRRLYQPAPTITIVPNPLSPSEDWDNTAREKDKQERVEREGEIERATERDAEMVRQRELEEISRREFEKAREREIEKARKHERRREQRERERAERRRLGSTAQIAHKPSPLPRHSRRPSPAKQMGLSPVSEGRQVTHPAPHTVPPPLHIVPPPTRIIEPPVKTVEGSTKPRSNTAATPITPIAPQSRARDQMRPNKTDPVIEIKSTPSSVPTLEPEPMNAKTPRAFTFDDPNRIPRTLHAPRTQAGPVPEPNAKVARVYISYDQVRARAEGVRTEEKTIKRRADATVGATAAEAVAKTFDRADGKKQTKEVELRTQGERRASEEQLGREQRRAEAERWLREERHAEEIRRRETAGRREREERARYEREKRERDRKQERDKKERERQERDRQEEERRRRWA